MVPISNHYEGPRIFEMGLYGQKSVNPRPAKCISPSSLLYPTLPLDIEFSP